MVYEVVVSNCAQQDLQKIIIWYDEQQTGLGARFLRCFLEMLEKIKHYPDHYPFIKWQYRRIVIRKFPYNIIYKLLDQVVLVLAILHQRRNPAELIKRIKK
jgi:plasmid stabilization system protein ParE